LGGECGGECEDGESSDQGSAARGANHGAPSDLRGGFGAGPRALRLVFFWSREKPGENDVNIIILGGRGGGGVGSGESRFFAWCSAELDGMAVW